MIVLVHNILPPYRVPLFNAIHDETDGAFRVLLQRENHPGRRKWTVPWDDVHFEHEILPGWSLDAAGQHRDLSFDVGRALDRIRPDAVVLAGWNLTSSWSALAWSRRRGIPVVAWVESWSDSGRRRGTLTNRVRRGFLGRADRIIVPGRKAEDYVRSLAPGARFVVMPNAIDVPELRALPRPRGDGALFVGELSERKGVDVILATLSELLDVVATVTFAGVGPLTPQVEAAAAGDERVTNLGFVEGADMVSAMSEASIVLLPSRRDPWPLVPVEALAAGRPVVLGPGVGSGPDLAPIGAPVAVMTDLSSQSLVDAVRRAAGATVPDDVRGSWSPEACAGAFVRAVTEARASRAAQPRTPRRSP